MLQLASNALPQYAQARLDSLQSEVDKNTSFAERVKKVESLWNGKIKSVAGKKTFDAVKETLKAMCVSAEICNYCEQNEANDIEHVYPKSLFPAMAFQWNNFLLACKQCNTAYKLDSFAVLDAEDNILRIPRGIEPPHSNGAFIHPRMENPADFMILNLGSFRFDLMPGLDKKNTNKAHYTLEVLQLNNRDQLVQSRKAAAIYRYQRMELLARILSAGSVSAIKELLTPYDDLIDDALPLSDLKQQLKEGFKKDVQSYPHPSVWYAIKKIQRIVDTKWQTIFSDVPEALGW